MTNRMRQLTVALVVLLALGAIATSAAMAQLKFSTTKVPLSVKSGSGSELRNSTGVLQCKSDSAEAEVSAPSTVSLPSLKFEGCSGEFSESPCPATISTKALKAELGEVAATEAKSRIGLLLAPREGTTIAEFSCGSSPIELSGNVAAEVEVISSAKLSGNVTFSYIGTSKTNIRLIVTTTTIKPSLTVGKLPATLVGVQTFSHPTSLFVCLFEPVGEFASESECEKTQAKSRYSPGWDQFYLM